MDPQPPTLSLPPLRNIDTHTLSTITAALINLRALYWPASLAHATWRGVRAPAAPKHHAHDSGYASAVEEEGDDDEGQARSRKQAQEKEAQEEKLMLLRADTLEHAFAVRWLTGFIARSEGWVSAGSECDSGDAETDEKFRMDKECEDRAHVVEEAAALLALSADTQADGTLSREFSFAVGGEGEERIVVELRDESYEGDHESVGLQTWGSACVLAERLCAEPGRYLGFDSQMCRGRGPRSIRVLELGAGTGLLSMVVAKLQGVLWVHELGVQLDVMATDYHPAVLENLQENVAHNFGGCVDLVRVEMLDWADTPVIEEADKFDVIIAADVIYDQRHGAWIKNCAERMLGAGNRKVMWLMVPMRPTRMGEVESLDNVFRGQEEESGLRILEVENVPRCHRIGRADEDGYRLFRIGWPM